jgi:hypothetical protein
MSTTSGALTREFVSSGSNAFRRSPASGGVGECKFHVVFIAKYRRKVLFGKLREHLGAVFRKLAEQKESRVEEGHVMSDHVTSRARVRFIQCRS